MTRTSINSKNGSSNTIVSRESRCLFCGRTQWPMRLRESENISSSFIANELPQNLSTSIWVGTWRIPLLRSDQTTTELEELQSARIWHRSLSASAVVFHYEEALYQVYAPLPLPLMLGVNWEKCRLPLKTDTAGVVKSLNAPTQGGMARLCWPGWFVTQRDGLHP